MLTVSLPLRPRSAPMVASLRIPTEDDECPILQEPIASAVLDRFPRPFLAEHPAHTAMTLPCKHTFHAMSLVYHWARNGNVLCPVCRAGPAGKRLTLNHLPKEWKHSMAARVRRERQQDLREQEEHNRQLAMQSVHRPPALELDIRIEAEHGTQPPFWTVRTNIHTLQNTVVFVVPPDELRRIPYPPATHVRLVPFTALHMLRPSDWFKAGNPPGGDFGVGYHDAGFQHMHLAVSDDLFATLVADVFMAQHLGDGMHVLVVNYP